MAGDGQRRAPEADLGGLLGDRMSVNRYEVRVESCDPRDSHVWLSLGRTKVAGRRWYGIRRGEKVRIQIRPEDVLLCLGPPGRLSARNVLPGRVTGVRHSPGGIRVDLDVGFPLSAIVTRAAVRDLGIRRGAALLAIVKASVVTPVVAVSPKHRISLVGSRGVLDYGKLDFMRELEHAGSLQAAAEELGISTRTAGIWASEINQVWDKPLLVRTHGGEGGGGTQLTPEGKAVLALAWKLEKREG
ncbi:MAG TPA: TOBE domain-containing protein [Planctomycetota bacterium]|nr:TOBE domain-containing protein [Planctomycetota bacterium]